MADPKLRTQARLHDGRVGEVIMIKYGGSPQGKVPYYLVRFSPDPADSTFCRNEDFVPFPDAEPES
jgi:hypothetical protein